MQAIGRQPQRAPHGAPIHFERHRPEQTALYRLVQQRAATFIAEAEAATGADLPQFVKDEFDALLVEDDAAAARDLARESLSKDRRHDAIASTPDERVECRAWPSRGRRNGRWKSDSPREQASCAR